MRSIFQKATLSTLVSIFLVLSMFAGAMPMVSAQSSPPSCPSNQILRITAPGGLPTNFNSLLAYNSGFGVEYLVEPGISPAYSATGQVLPGNSISDVITHNSNYTQWTFHIASNQTWSNGLPVNASDVLGTYSSYFALNKTYDPVPLGPEVKSIVAVNSSTVTFNLNQSDAWLSYKLTQPVDTVVYPTSFTSHGAAWPGYGTQVNAGPWYIYNYVSGSSVLTMYRNPYYKPQPAVCEIIFNFVESFTSDPTYLLSGSSDLALVPPTDIASLSSNSNIHITPNPGYYATYLQYNVTNYPYNMSQFRQALAYGINQGQLVQSGLNGYGLTAYSAQGEIPPISGFYNPNQQAYSYNPTQASSLLQQIGIKKGSDGYLQFPNGTDISMTVWTGTNPSWDVTLAGLVQANLQSLGFKVTVQSTAYQTLIGYLVGNDNGLQNALILHTSSGVSYGNPLVDVLPSRTTFASPGYQFGSTWMPTQSSAAEYNGNLTTLEGDSSPSTVTQTLNNIQALYAQNLPLLMLDYPDTPVAYSTLHWTNWPTSNSSFISTIVQYWNVSALTNLQPISSATSSSSSTSIVSTSTPSSSATGGTSTTSSASSKTSASASSSSPATSSTSSSSAVSFSPLGPVIMVGAILAIGSAVVAFRPRSKMV